MNAIPKKLGRYNIIREIGRGAMGVVYKAYDPVIEREVAIKAIQLSFSVTNEEKQMYLNRFYREAKAAGKLNHPNIVTIYDVDEDKESGTPFIVMEYLEGTTLQEVIAEGILLPLDDVKSIVIQIADALNYAHKQGIIHRDVKSANIILLQGLKAKIMDFGIARIASSDLTKSGQFMGTPNYMSPEQIDGKMPVDGRSDLFALGVIFYLLITGERPFSGDSFTSISYKIVHVNPIPPRTVNPSVPEVYNRILTRLLAKDPAQRYSTGADLIADLRKADGGRPADDSIPELPESAMISPPVNKGSSASAIRAASAHRLNGGLMPQQPRISEQPFKRAIVPVALAAAVITAGGFYFFRTPAQDAVPAIPSRKASLEKKSEQPQVNEEFIRQKLDLALNYSKNGFYDKGIQELQEILRIDPKNQEAKKYLDHLTRVKSEAESIKASPARPKKDK